MTDRQTIAEQLAALGREPVAPVEPRLDDLEARLLTAIGDDREHRLVPVPGTPERRGHRLLLGAAAALLALGVAGVLLVPKDNDDSIVIAAAADVSVILPDGTGIVGSIGLELPDGATLEVDGFVEVDGRRFGPGRYAVDDGDLVVVPIRTEASTTVPTEVVRVTPPGTRPAPTRPVAPSLPVAPSIPSTPSIPVAPSIPSTPSIPVAPSVPVAPSPTRPARTTTTRPGPERTIPASTVRQRPTTTAVRQRPTTTVRVRPTTSTTIAGTIRPSTTGAQRGPTPETTRAGQTR